MAFAVFLLAITIGCSSTPTKKSQTGVQFVQPTSSPSIDQGQSINVTVSVSDNSSVTWKLEAAFGAAKGTLSNKTGTGATYNAPANLSAETQVTIVATSGTASAALPVFVQPAPQITGTNVPPPSSCPANRSIVLPNPSGGINPAGQTIAQGSAGSLVFKLAGGVLPYTWSVASGSLPDGLTLQVGSDTSAPFIAGTPTTPGCSTFTVQVTDAAGVSDTSAKLHLVIIPPALKVNAPSFHDGLVDSANNGIPYAPATMLASGGTPPYSWSINPAVSDPGSLFPTNLSMTSGGLITGTPTAAALTGNGNLSGSYTPSLLVSDSQFPYPATATPTPSINIIAQPTSCFNGAPGNLKAQGSYAFQLHGFDANGPVTISGNFMADGTGNITGGNEDISRNTGAQNGLSIQSGTYTLDLSNRGCISLVNSVGTTSTFRIAMGGCSTGRDSKGKDCQPAQNGGSYYLTSGHMTEFDDNIGSGTRVSGVVRLQDPSTFQTSSISGMYAFGLSGWDGAKARFAMAGSASASSGSWTSVAADSNDAGTLGTSLSGGSGAFTVGTTGRGTGTMTIGSLSLSFVIYPVSSNEVLLATIGPPTAGNPLLTGEAITTAGPFNFQALQNSHMFHLAGVSTQGPDPSIGTLAFDGIGGVTGTAYENQAGTLSSASLSGGYTMDGSSGRFAFVASANQNLGLHPLVGYVIPAPGNLTFTSCITRAACITGFLLSTDATAQAGVLEFQTPSVGPPPPFSTASLQGDYMFGTDEALDSKTLQFSGHASVSSSASFGPIQDDSYGDPNYCLVSNCVLLISSDEAGGVPYSINSDGSGAWGGQTVSVTNGSTSFYIDESPLNHHPAVVVVEQ